MIDFTSLSHLCYVLEYLKSHSSVKIRRQKPAYLEYNIPNLIICPQNEVIKKTLGIYMLSPDQPLPTDDEVLYCTERTSAEQLELFWKRLLSYGATNDKAENVTGVDRQEAESNDTQKIYCLMNVQDLLYDQALQAQRSFDRLLTEHEGTNAKPFVLCLICAAEKEDKSIFVTSFSRYKRNIPQTSVSSESEITAYLARHLAFNVPQNKLAGIENDNLSARIITSNSSGVGKSFYVSRLIEQAKETNQGINNCCISIKKPTLPLDDAVEQMKAYELEFKQNCMVEGAAAIYHVDIAYEVWYNVDYFLFNLLCLGVLHNGNGTIFRRSPRDLFLFEIMAPKLQAKSEQTTTAIDNNGDEQQARLKPLHSVMEVLPTLRCLTPVETLQVLTNQNELKADICPMLFDEKTLQSHLIQRPCQYLECFKRLNSFEAFTYPGGAHISAKKCLELLISHIENTNPSWSEVIHFASFLNTQLMDCEKSPFCNVALIGNDLPGFKTFVVKFMIQMSHDFALRSLNISDCSTFKMNMNNQAEFQLHQLSMRRRWETEPHPYL